MSAALCTLAGPSAVYIDPEVERWLLARIASPEVTHLVHAPSNPMGWSAGKWMEWYPDVLIADGKLTTSEAEALLAKRMAEAARSPDRRA